MELFDLNKKIGKSKGEFLKVIAMITMVIDHIGYGGYPDVSVLRMIGRLSLPIFCYLIVQGYLHTSNIKKYAARLFVFAVISQIPYVYYFEKSDLNIFITLFLGLLALYAIENKLWILFFSLVVTSVAVPMDYGIYVIFMIMLFYAFEKDILGQKTFFMWFLAGTVGAAFLGAFPEQIFAIFSPFIIYFAPNIDYRIKMPKYLYYVFYPAHLIILSFIFK